MSTLLRQLKGESQRYTKMDSHGLGKLLDSAAERIAELEKELEFFYEEAMDSKEQNK